MKNIWFKYKFSIIILGYALLAGVFMYFAIIPLVKNIKLLAYQIQSKSIDREIEKSKIAKLPEIRKEWSDFESRANLLNVILGQKDQVGFIESVESIAQSSGNKITLKIQDNDKDVSFSMKNKDMLKSLAYPNYFPVQISLEGDYAGLVSFIHLLENSHFYVNIISISATKSTVTNDGNENPFDSGNVANNQSDVANTNDTIKTDISAVVYIQKP